MLRPCKDGTMTRVSISGMGKVGMAGGPGASLAKDWQNPGAEPGAGEGLVHAPAKARQ